MVDIYFFFFITVLFFLLGVPFSRLLPKDTFRMRWLIAPTLGYGIMAVIIPVLYQHGISIRSCFEYAVFIAGCIAVIFAYLTYGRIKRIGRIKLIFLLKTAVVFLLIWLLGTMIMLLPKVVGGNQFAVFQGNQWDTFNYLNSAVVYAKAPFQSIENANKISYLNNPLLPYAQLNLACRPSVHMLYSFAGQLLPAQYHCLYYTFLVFFFSQAILAFMFMIMNIFSSVKAAWAGILSLVFPLGFWGQYVLDINAWSQIAFIPLILIILGIVILAFSKMPKVKIDSGITLRLMLLLSVLFAAALYLYPEGLLFYLPALFLASAAFFTFSVVKRTSWFIIFIVLGSLCLGVMAGLLFYNGTLGTLIKQFGFAGAQKVDWWLYFQGFLSGRDVLNASLFDNIIDFMAGIFGLYLITPSSAYNFAAAFMIRLFIATLLSGLLYAFYIMIRLIIFPKAKTKIQYKWKTTGNVLLFTALIVLIILSWGYGIIYNSGGGTVEVKLNGLNQSGLARCKVVLGAMDLKPIYVSRNGKSWTVTNVYFRNVGIEVPQDMIARISSINILLNSKIIVFSGRDFRDQWIRSGSSDSSAIVHFRSPGKNISAVFPGLNDFKTRLLNRNNIISAIPYKDILAMILLLGGFMLVKYRTNILDSEWVIDDTEARKPIFYLLIILVSAMLLITYVLIAGKFWAAGKFLSYVSPYFMLLLVVPVILLRWNGKNIAFKAVLLVFVILQLSFGLVRIYGAGHNDGIHYDFPYPSILNESLKTQINWNIDKLSPYIKDSKMIKVDVKNRWLESYLMLYLYENDKKYYSINVINDAYGVGKNIGYQVPKAKADLIITDEKYQQICRKN